MDRFACRKAVVEELKKQNLLRKIEPIVHSVGHSERTGVIVEPRLSEQWFVAMRKLADDALAKSTVEFVPERFEKMFVNWMREIEDWCISRQLWWGHRIPVWYRGEEIHCGPTAPGPGWVQDEDVLDTWFSSALWPFSTLDWPNESSPLYQRYYPTDVLVTAYDIIFFWVARMIFTAIEFTGKSPFRQCLIHGLIRDSEGRKMSKSLGNGVDPLDVVREHGTDALRYFIATNSAPGQDLRYEEEKVVSSWNYINKIWNISRYVLMVCENADTPMRELNEAELSFADKWIIHRLNNLLVEADSLFDKYEFNEAARLIYNFIWDDFASWYVEMSKLDQDKPATRKTLLHVLEAILKLNHPFMPFVTEDIYLRLPAHEKSIMTASWPRPNGMTFPETADKTWFFALIKQIRQVRNEYGVSYKKAIPLFIKASPALEAFIHENRAYLDKFLNIEQLAFITKSQETSGMLSFLHQDVSAYLPLGSLIDLEAERLRLEKEKLELEQEIVRAASLLENPGFLAKAPESKIQAERQKRELNERRLEETLKKIGDLRK